MNDDYFFLRIAGARISPNFVFLSHSTGSYIRRYVYEESIIVKLTFVALEINEDDTLKFSALGKIFNFKNWTSVVCINTV